MPVPPSFYDNAPPLPLLLPGINHHPNLREGILIRVSPRVRGVRARDRALRGTLCVIKGAEESVVLKTRGKIFHIF
jgi:hypothetical protein